MNPVQNGVRLKQMLFGFVYGGMGISINIKWGSVPIVGGVRNGELPINI